MTRPKTDHSVVDEDQASSAPARAGCDFCRKSAPSFESADTQDVVLGANEHFLAWPCLGAYLPGWSLIVPKRHMVALAAIDEAEEGSLEALRAEMVRRIRLATRCSVWTFEHGPAREGLTAGCSVDHAHLHLVPTSIDLARRAERSLADLVWVRNLTRRDLRAAHWAGLSYLTVEGPDGTTMTAVAEDFPSQFFRRLVAEESGLPFTSWRKDPRRSTVRATVELLDRSARSCEEAELMGYATASAVDR